jgi:nucleoside phosphorylase
MNSLTEMTNAEIERADILIIVALREEFREFVRLLSSTFSSRKVGGRTYYQFSRARYRLVATLIGEMGNVSAATATEAALHLFSPSTVVSLGLAAGIHKDVSLGDIVVATTVDNYLENVKATPSERSRFELGFSGNVYRETSAALLDVIRNFEFTHAAAYTRWRDDCLKDRESTLPDSLRSSLTGAGLLRDSVALLDGPCASGPLVAASAEFLQDLRARNRNYLALDMESGGVQSAAYLTAGTHTGGVIVIRGISDLGDERKADLEGVGQSTPIRSLAMRNAVRLLWSVCDEGLLRQEPDGGVQTGGATTPPSPSIVPANLDWTLYDRRKAAYDSYMGFLYRLMFDYVMDAAAIRGFGKDIQEARFLFDDTIYMFLDSIYANAIGFRALRERRNTASSLSESELARLVDEDNRLQAWFTAQIGEAPKLFGRYLSLAGRI